MRRATSAARPTATRIRRPMAGTANPAPASTTDQPAASPASLPKATSAAGSATRRATGAARMSPATVATPRTAMAAPWLRGRIPESSGRGPSTRRTRRRMATAVHSASPAPRPGGADEEEGGCLGQRREGEQERAGGQRGGCAQAGGRGDQAQARDRREGEDALEVMLPQSQERGRGEGEATEERDRRPQEALDRDGRGEPHQHIT